MEHQTTTGPASDVLWLTDKEGNSYLVRRETIEAHRVPDHVRGDVQEFIESDTRGYGNAEWWMEGITKLWGLKWGDDGFDQNFDLDGSGDIGAGDWEIAKKAWYEQNPPKNPYADSNT